MHPRRRVAVVEAGAAADDRNTRRAISEATFAVVDVETTGLSARKHRLLQVAVVLARADGTVLDRWVSYVKPRFRWFVRLGPTHIHGIRRRDLKGAPSLDAVVTEVSRRVGGTILTAHNLGFDRAFLQAGARRTGLVLGHDAEVCTLVLARKLDPENLWSHKLGDLCERYAIPLVNAHDALADAEATARLLPFLIAESGLTTVEELVEMTAWRKRQPGTPDASDPTGELTRPTNTA